jgi:metallo-beta-lactamase class B
MKIVGPIYFVGTKGLGVWLIKTSEGHILLNTGMPSSGPLDRSSTCRWVAGKRQRRGLHLI